MNGKHLILHCDVIQNIKFLGKIFFEKIQIEFKDVDFEFLELFHQNEINQPDELDRQSNRSAQFV